MASQTSTSEQILDERLTSPAFVQDPYPTYALLREHAPVHWCRPWRAWVVTSHEHVSAVLPDNKTFSSGGYELGFVDALEREHGIELPSLRSHYGARMVNFSDPPDHGRLRRPIVKGLGPRILDEVRPTTERLVRERIAALGDGGRVDVVHEYTYPIPALVIAGLLGVPEGDREQFCGWSSDVVAFIGVGAPERGRAEAAERSMLAFRTYLRRLIAAARVRAPEDLLAILAQGGEKDDPLTDDELLATCVTLIFAGHETTANLVGNTLVALMAAPAEQQALRDEPDLVPGAIEEAMRFDGSVQRIRRIAACDVELGGREIRKGDPVLNFIAAANRDEHVFDDPDRFDVRRRPAGRNLGFGYGPHFCVGAALARMEAPMMLGALLERFDSITLAGPVRFRDNIVMRGPAELQLELG